MLPSTRLSVVPPLSPIKDNASRYTPFITKPKVTSTSTVSYDSSYSKSATTTTFPPAKNSKHKWVFPTSKRSLAPTSVKKDESPSVLIHHPFFMPVEVPSPSATTLNAILQQLTPASTVPCMFVFFVLLLRVIINHLIVSFSLYKHRKIPQHLFPNYHAINAY